MQCSLILRFLLLTTFFYMLNCNVLFDVCNQNAKRGKVTIISDLLVFVPQDIK